jgi:hypothetical protein
MPPIFSRSAALDMFGNLNYKQCKEKCMAKESRDFVSRKKKQNKESSNIVDQPHWELSLSKVNSKSTLASHAQNKTKSQIAQAKAPAPNRIHTATSYYEEDAQTKETKSV